MFSRSGVDFLKVLFLLFSSLTSFDSKGLWFVLKLKSGNDWKPRSLFSMCDLLESMWQTRMDFQAYRRRTKTHDKARSSEVWVCNDACLTPDCRCLWGAETFILEAETLVWTLTPTEVHIYHTWIFNGWGCWDLTVDKNSDKVADQKTFESKCKNHPLLFPPAAVLWTPHNDVISDRSVQLARPQTTLISRGLQQGLFYVIAHSCNTRWGL